MLEVEEKIFSINLAKDRPYEYPDSVHFAINYEMNRNLVMYEREVYTSLDWFGNVGGLFEGLKLFFGMLVAFFNYKFYTNFMV